MARTSLLVPFSAIDDVREITRSERTLDRSAITSSVKPSAKYSFSASGLRFVNGSTAIGCDGAPPSQMALDARG